MDSLLNLNINLETGIRAINAQNLIAEAIAAYKRNPVVFFILLNKIFFI